MAWRSELNYTFDGAADSAWDEDPHVQAVLKKDSASGRAPGSILTRRGQFSNEAAVVAAGCTPDLAETSEEATGKSWVERGLPWDGPHLRGARHARQEDSGAKSVVGVGRGTEMKRKGGLSSLAECADAGCSKKAQRQAGAGLSQGAMPVLAAGEESTTARGASLTLRSRGGADLPALEDATSPRVSLSSKSISHQGGDPVLDCPQHSRLGSSLPALDVHKAGSPHHDGTSEAPPLLLADLPPALLLEVLSHLRAHDLSVVACVSRLFRGLAAESQGWKNFYCERWRPAHPLQGPPAEGAEAHVAPHGRSWKELYVEREVRSSSLIGTFRADLLHGHTASARCVKILPGSPIVASGGYDRSVRLWDLDTGMPLAMTAPLDETVRSVAIDHDSLAAGTSDGALRVWHASNACSHLFDLGGQVSLGSESSFSSPDRWWGHGGPVSCLALEEGRLYSGSWDMTAKVWATDASSDSVLRVFTHRDWVWALVVRRGTLLSTAGPDLYRWDVETGRLLTLRRRVHGQAHAVQGTRSGHFTFTAGDDGAVRLFDERLPSRKGNESGAEEAVVAWRPHAAAINALAFEDPWLVAASSDAQLSMLDARGYIHGPRRGPGHAPGPRHRAPAGPSGGPETGAVSRRLGAFATAALCVDLDGVRLVAGGEGPSHVLRVWDFSQALEIERRVQASRQSRQRQRQKKRHDNQESVERTAAGSSAGSRCGKQETGRSSKEGRARGDGHPRLHLARPHPLPREPLAKMSVHSERSKERGKGRGGALRGAEKASSDEVWQIKGRGR